MLRFIIRTKHRDAYSGAQWDEHRTLDIAVPELERALFRTGGLGDGAYTINELIGVELLPDAAPAQEESNGR